MYATCIFCHGKLGTNEVIEPFPVGKRLAFDASLGRLWVVCASCGRWNLSPLEERWEAIAGTEVCRRWWASMRELMPSHADDSPVTRDLKEVFTMEGG